MAQPVTVSLNGAVTASPAVSSPTSPSLQDILNISTNRVYGYKTGNSTTVNNPLVGSPFVLPLSSMTKIRFFAMRALGNSLQVLVTSAAGTDQTFKVSDVMVWSSPNEGDQITAIKLVGVSDVEYLLAGD